MPAISITDASMRRGTLLVPLLVATAACVPRTTVRQTIAQTVVSTDAPPSMVAPAAFVAAVPAFDEGGRCATYPIGGGGHLVVLSFAGPGGAKRNVSMHYDASGRLTSYSDLRGALDPRAPGPMTSVSIGFDTRMASAMNEHTPEGTQGLLVAKPEDLLDLPNLGTPRQMMDTVKEKCGT
jgi:hypothetical protein